MTNAADKPEVKEHTVTKAELSGSRDAIADPYAGGWREDETARAHACQGGAVGEAMPVFN